MIDATAKPLLYLCRRRAYLLRTALEALVPVSTAPVSLGRRVEADMDSVERTINAVESLLESQKEDARGRDSD